MIDLVTAAPHVRAHRGALFVIKVGGECLSSPARIERVAAELALVEAYGPRLVIVHGAGPQTDALQRGLGEEPTKLGGRRVTSRLGLRALQHATLGELGPALASALSLAGATAVTLGAGSGVLRATRRPPVEQDGATIDFGEVGDLCAVDPAPVRAMLASGLCPVLSPPASDGAGGQLNVNADLAAAHLAMALGAKKLCLMTGVDGLLEDPDDPRSLLSTSSGAALDRLEERGALRGGMLVKIAAARLALAGGVPRIHVVSGMKPGALVTELFTAEGSGTLITSETVTSDSSPSSSSASRSAPLPLEETCA